MCIYLMTMHTLRTSEESNYNYNYVYPSACILLLVFPLSITFCFCFTTEKKAEILYVFQKSKPFLSDIQFPNFYMNLL